MKINIDVDLTPEEARKVMGLPDLEPMQQAVMKQIQGKIMQKIDDITDVENLYSRFFPLGMQSMEQMQKFFSGLLSMASTETGKKEARK